MNLRALRSMRRELEKLAVEEYYIAHQRALPRVARPPQVPARGGPPPPDLNLSNFGAEFQRRYPKLQYAQQMGTLTTALQDRYRAAGGDPNILSIMTQHQRGGPDIGENSHASYGVPGKDGGTVRVTSNNPLTFGHEVGHGIDDLRGIDFGKRGFFGFGGRVSTMIPSEVSASQHALDALPQASSRVRAATLAATGTYIQGTERVGSVSAELHSAYDDALKAAKERAQPFNPTVPKFGAGLGNLRTQLETRVPGHAERFRREDKMYRVRTLQEQRAGTLADQLMETYPNSHFSRHTDTPFIPRELVAAAQADPRYRQLQRYRAQFQRSRGEQRNVLKPAERVAQERLNRVEALSKSRATHKGVNPFIDPLWEKMTPVEQANVRAYVDDLGSRLGEHFGPEQAKNYTTEMMRSLENPTRARLRYHVPEIPLPAAANGFKEKALGLLKRLWRK